MYDVKAIYEASSIQNAIELLKDHPEAKIIAGGSDILISIRNGSLKDAELVSIYGLDELRGIAIDSEGTIKIGALTSFSHIAKDPIINENIKVLAEAVDMVGGPQIRNIGTIGGNVCNGVTSADSASTLMAFDAIMEIEGPEGIREISIKEWYIKAKQVALKPCEILTSIKIKKESYEGYKGHYIKYAMRNAMDIATIGCSVNVKLSRDTITFEDVRIAYGVAGPVPMRAILAEEFLRGKAVNEENINAFSEKVLEDINPRDSWRAGKEFREHLCKILAKRALTEAVKLNNETAKPNNETTKFKNETAKLNGGEF